MILFEIETGYVGESYERCYAWAVNELDARAMFAHAQEEKTGEPGTPKGPRTIRAIKALFPNDMCQFITDLSDSGFGMIPQTIRVLGLPPSTAAEPTGAFTG